MRKFGHLFATILMTLPPLVAVGARAQAVAASLPASGPSAFVLDLAQSAFLGSSAAESEAAENQRLGHYLDNAFDVPAIAGFVLGRYWPKATDAEQKQFIGVFRDYLVRVYAGKLSAYRGQTMRVVNETADVNATIVVSTEIMQKSSDQPVQVDWRVRDQGGLRVVDIGVGGVSLAQVQRDDFLSILRQNGGDIAGLIKRLQGMNAPLQP
jgi:phospholipid transport system substrate-binding protein